MKEGRSLEIGHFGKRPGDRKRAPSANSSTFPSPSSHGHKMITCKDGVSTSIDKGSDRGARMPALFYTSSSKQEAYLVA